MKFYAQSSWCVAAAIIVFGCGNKPQVDQQRTPMQISGAQRTSDSTTTPASGKFLATFPAIQPAQLSVINGAKVSLTSSAATNAQCQSREKLFAPSSNTISIDDAVVATCSYNVTIQLGAQDASNVFVPYYLSEQLMMSVAQGGTQTLNFSRFTQTDQGRAKNLPAFDQIIASSTTPSTQTPGSTTPAPSNAAPVFSKVKIADSTGAQKTLADIARGKYIYIDLSAAWCGYCKQLAGEINKDEELAGLVEKGTCSMATIVADDDLQGWLKLFPTSTHAGSHSFGSAEFYNVPTYFGKPKPQGIPYVMITEVATGKVVSENRDLDAYKNMCNK